ncbi:MAG: ATP-binding protein [Ignavibacteriae bacterium]|nr:ATP-binding protein [Ignavibacteriota bacterium]
MRPLGRLCIFLLLNFGIILSLGADRPDKSAKQSGRPKSSEEIRFEHINVDDGLSHGGIYCILKDRQGFMWFGTAKGLNRYDGYGFRVFQEDPNDSNSLGGNLVYALLEDRDGFIWIGTVGEGLSRFDPVHEKFTRYTHTPGVPRSLSNNQVYALFQDHAGALWIGTRDGLDRFDTRAKTFAHFDPETEERDDPIVNQVTAIYERAATPGVLWIGTWGGGLKRFDVATRTFRNYRHDPNNPNTLSHNSIRVIYEAPLLPNVLWICTEGGGLNRFDIATESFKCYKTDPFDPNSLSHDAVRSIVQDRSGIIWVGTSGAGLNRFDPATETFVRYRHGPRWTSSLSNDNVIAMFVDETGMHWLGTREGLNRFSAVKENIVLYQHDADDSTSLSGNFLYSLHEDKSGILWISTGSGLNRFDPATETFTRYTCDPQNPRTLRNNYVRIIYEDRSGILWIGNTHGVLHKLDRSTGWFTPYIFLNDPNNEKVNDILSLLEDKSGRFWVGTVEGLYTFDRSKGTATPVNVGPLVSSSASLQYVYALYEDRDGAFWIGTRYKGLIRVQAQDTSTFAHATANPHSLANNHVLSINEDKSGTLWVGTAGGGLNRFDRDKKQFTAFTTDDGLPDNTVYGFLEDNSGNLWLSTNKGLCRFNPRTHKCRNFETRHGLQGSEFNFLSFCRSQRGMMYFGGVNGLNAFLADSIGDNTHVPPVFITALKVSDSSVTADTSLSYLRAIEIPYHERFVSFEFAALDFKDPQRNTYAHKLEGFDVDWIRSGTRRYAAYTNLDPGTYVFKVRGANNDGVWSERGASLQITIPPPYWLTWWFRLLVISAFIALLYGLHRYRLVKGLELERMRVRIASDLHDDIGATLTHIVMQSELVQMSDDIQQIKTSSQHIGNAGRTIIATLSDIVWSIDARNDSLGNLLDRMRDFASEVLAPRSIHVHFENAGFDERKKIPVDVRQNVYLILKEAITNIARHSNASKVHISLRQSDGQFTMTIADDGKGLNGDEANRKRTGHGLRNMQMRAERVGGTVEILHEQGVTVVFRMNGL